MFTAGWDYPPSGPGMDDAEVRMEEFGKWNEAAEWLAGEMRGHAQEEIDDDFEMSEMLDDAADDMEQAEYEPNFVMTGGYATYWIEES